MKMESNDKVFKEDAKQLVDTVFEKGWFKSEITRDDMNSIEDLITYLLQSRFDSYKRIKDITDKINKTKLQ
jgi:hypothetical protein